MTPLSATAADHSHSQSANDSTSRRFRVFSALSIFVGILLLQSRLQNGIDDSLKASYSHSNSTTTKSSSDAKKSGASKNIQSALRTSIGDSDSRSSSTTAKSSSKSSIDASKSTKSDSESNTSELQKHVGKSVSQASSIARQSESTCHVTPVTRSKQSRSTSISNCITNMGKRFHKNRQELVKGLPMNPRAHLFSFHRNVRDAEGLHPLLCVPQKNGNKQFGGLVYSAWHNKPAKDGYQVDSDMKHWEIHSLDPTKSASHKSHVYFVARNPYTRILSMYLQKVVNACISGGQKGCNKPKGWHGIKPSTSFERFVEIIEKRVEKRGSLCGISHHVCQQVETCLTNTLPAAQVTVIRVEEESCWFPCLVQQIGVKPKVLSKGWEQFSGQSCYYSATGNCSGELLIIWNDNMWRCLSVY